MRKAIAVVIIAGALVFTVLSLTGCADVADLPELDLTGEIRLSNPSPKVGETITAVYNRCNGTGEQTWRWFHADTNALIKEGAAAATYTATADDVGKKIKVLLTFANQMGSLSAVTDSEVATVTDNGSDPGDGETGSTGNANPGDGTDPTDNGSDPGDGTDPTDNGSDLGDGETDPTGNGEIDVVPIDPVLSRFLGWRWEKPSDGFVWVFYNDGTIFGIHHCGEGWNNFSYLIRGNVLISYGSEMNTDELIVTTFIMTEDGDSFTRINGSNQTLFVRRQADARSSPDLPLVLSNTLLGTWQGTDGTEYTFSSDAGLQINSEQYGYLVRNNKLVTLSGDLDDVTTAVIKEYQFKRTGDNLELTPSGGAKITLSLKK